MVRAFMQWSGDDVRFNGHKWPFIDDALREMLRLARDPRTTTCTVDRVDLRVHVERAFLRPEVESAVAEICVGAPEVRLEVTGP